MSSDWTAHLCTLWVNCAVLNTLIHAACDVLAPINVPRRVTIGKYVLGIVLAPIWLVALAYHFLTAHSRH